MMTEYIKKSEALDVLKPLPADNLGDPFNLGINYARRKINAIPAADVSEVKHGKWIEVQKENIWNDIVPVLECSACGKYTVGTRGIMTKSNYCPNCGAKMDLED